MGIREITLIDFDDIELSNTSRQILYDETDVNKKKLDVAKTKLSKYNSELKINTVNQYIDSKDKLSKIINEDVDILLCCADNPRGRISYIVNDVCLEMNIPFLIVSPLIKEIRIGPFVIPNETKSLREIIPQTYEVFQEKELNLNKNFFSDIIEPYNALAANFGVLEVIKFFTSIQEISTKNTILIIDPLNFQVDKIQVTNNLRT